MTNEGAEEGDALVRSSGIFRSQDARNYLLRLAKHFSHKVEVHHDHDQGRARIGFSCGTVLIAAEDDRLSLEVYSQNVEDRRETEDVLESHLERFAFREAPVSIVWTRHPDRAADPIGEDAQETS